MKRCRAKEGAMLTLKRIAGLTLIAGLVLMPIQAQKASDKGVSGKDVKEKMDGVKADKADVKDALEKALEVLASSLALTPSLLHIDSAFCAGWYVELNMIIAKYTPLSIYDEKAFEIVRKAEELKKKLGRVSDEHAAMPDPPPPD